MARRRPYGSGSLFVHRTRAGKEIWYGRFRTGNTRAKRSIGPKRQAGSRTGLTQAQAERALQRLIEGENRSAPRERLTLPQAGDRYLAHLASAGRKPSTLTDYESYLRVQLVPFFGDRTLDRIDPELIEAFIAAKQRERKATKSIRNWVGLLHGIYAYAERRRWVGENPCRLVELPASADSDPDIRFLHQDQLEAVLEAVPDGGVGRAEHALYLTGAMTGLRQGELLALRWRDIDRTAAKVRVRRNLVRGRYGTPKSRRSSRAVPMGTRLIRELRSHQARSAYRAPDDLVFCHPQLGTPLDRSKVRKRFLAAVKRAGIRDHVRFHDLRHTFGTRMAAEGVPLRTLQEWMGHRDIKTTQIYADYQPSPTEQDLVDQAFAAEPGRRMEPAQPITRRTT